MSTDDIFRARLLAKETSLRALSKKYLAFVNSLDSASEEEVQVAHQALTKDLAAYEFAMVKARTLIDTSGRQVGDYVQMSKAIEAEMAHTREDIERLSGGSAIGALPPPRSPSAGTSSGKLALVTNQEVAGAL